MSTTGESGNDFSFGSSISANGRFVAFSSIASNLVEGDTNGTEDIFVRDLVTGITERVNISPSGEQANGDSSAPSVSADGRYVAFASFATNLVDNDTNGQGDVFVHDRSTGEVERISISSAGVQANSRSGFWKHGVKFPQSVPMAALSCFFRMPLILRRDMIMVYLIYLFMIG